MQSPIEEGFFDRKDTKRRDTIQLSSGMRYLRRLRFRVYYFLDHPMSSRSTWYHFGVFSFVLMAVVLGATSYAWDDYFLKEVHLYMESVLALFFLSEFFVRMWSVSADAKYVGCRGRLRYLTRLVSVVDIIIIVVTIMMVYLEKRYVSDGTLDYLRLVQILRLFHIDRQMSTWRLIKNMIMLGKWELLAAYYITFILCLLMVNLIFISENEGFTWQIPKNSSEITKSSSFPTLAHAWWFTIVSILTIGYGDIVPSQWTSRIIVCFLGFLAYCTFVAASTQISVGLTLMMEEDNKKECRNKIRSTAASVIQCWYRFHLASEAERKMTEYFRRICFKLYVTDKRMNRNHQLAAKLRENVVKRKKMRSTVVTPDSWKQQLGIGVAQHIMQTINFEVPRNRRVTELKRNWSVPETESHKEVDTNEVYQRRGSSETIISSSFDISDIETRIDTNNMYEEDRSDSNTSEIDDWRLYKYKPLLRFFNFLLFREYTKKFRRLRKADLLLELDAEIREQENVRQQNLRELELRVNAMLGRPTTSPFHSNESEKLCMSRRLDLCESKMLEMRRTMDKIHILVRELAKILEVPTHQALPPTPPGRRVRHHRRHNSLRRQHVQGEESDEDE
ncbi:hypothetical protein RB195_018186 [Necator americanus]|uniref:Ion transport domain-containing protein n=1 Tax=Necator americanus TaxID=51031 RepID=A0ABR1CC77_NECAM